MSKSSSKTVHEQLRPIIYYSKREERFVERVNAAVEERKDEPQFAGLSYGEIWSLLALDIAEGFKGRVKNISKMDAKGVARPSDPMWDKYTYEEILAMAENGVVVPSEILDWAKSMDASDSAGYEIDNIENFDIESLENVSTQDNSPDKKKKLAEASARAEYNADELEKDSNVLERNSEDLESLADNLEKKIKESSEKIEAYSSEFQSLEEKIDNGEVLSDEELSRYKSLGAMLNTESKEIILESKDVSEDIANIESAMQTVSAKIEESEALDDKIKEIKEDVAEGKNKQESSPISLTKRQEMNDEINKGVEHKHVFSKGIDSTISGRKRANVHTVNTREVISESAWQHSNMNTGKPSDSYNTKLEDAASVKFRSASKSDALINLANSVMASSKKPLLNAKMLLEDAQSVEDSYVVLNEKSKENENNNKLVEENNSIINDKEEDEQNNANIDEASNVDMMPESNQVEENPNPEEEIPENNDNEKVISEVELTENDNNEKALPEGEELKTVANEDVIPEKDEVLTEVDNSAETEEIQENTLTDVNIPQDSKESQYLDSEIPDNNVQFKFNATNNVLDKLFGRTELGASGIISNLSSNSSGISGFISNNAFSGIFESILPFALKNNDSRINNSSLSMPEAEISTVAQNNNSDILKNNAAPEEISLNADASNNKLENVRGEDISKDEARAEAEIENKAPKEVNDIEVTSEEKESAENLAKTELPSANKKEVIENKIESLKEKDAKDSNKTIQVEDSDYMVDKPKPDIANNAAEYFKDAAATPLDSDINTDYDAVRRKVEIDNLRSGIKAQNNDLDSLITRAGIFHENNRSKNIQLQSTADVGLVLNGQGSGVISGIGASMKADGNVSETFADVNRLSEIENDALSTGNIINGDIYRINTLSHRNMNDVSSNTNESQQPDPALKVNNKFTSLNKMVNIASDEQADKTRQVLSGFDYTDDSIDKAQNEYNKNDTKAEISHFKEVAVSNDIEGDTPDDVDMNISEDVDHIVGGRAGDLTSAGIMDEEVMSNVHATNELTRRIAKFDMADSIQDSMEEVNEDLAQDESVQTLAKNNAQELLDDAVLEVAKLSLVTYGEKVQQKDVNADTKRKVLTRFEIKRRDEIKRGVEKISSAAKMKH